jgi:hypothetical protein
MPLILLESVKRLLHPTCLRSRLTLWFLGAIWIAGIIGGGRYMLRFETTPGMAATPDTFWPDELPIQRAQDRMTLVMIAQPACTCTRASVGELETVISQHPDRAKVFVIFEKNGVGIDPQGSSLWQAALRVPGATVLVDQAATICHRFHVATSGQVFVFDRSGKLCYSGGITSSRGHEGESDGSRAIDALLSGRTAETTSTPVFGCSAN